MRSIDAQGISKSFHLKAQLPVLRDLSLSVPAGGFVAVIGPSGSGKSTLLNIMAGLETPDSGRVLVDGRDATGRLGFAGYMPQKDLLLPWKRVLDNVTLGPELSGVDRRMARQDAAGWFARFGLAGFENAYPRVLSGGMRQRAALLRTFLSRRDILLLDEPFGALDALTRIDLQAWLLDVWAELTRTILLVTHDVDEAIFLADRIYVLSPRPAAVAAVLDVPLPRPRDYDETVVDPTAIALKRDILALLRRSPVLV